MKNMSSSLAFGSILNASLQVRGPHFRMSVKHLQCLHFTRLYLTNAVFRRRWLKHLYQDSRRSVEAETS